MDIKEIITRNYAATVRRGLIKPETTKQEFISKLEEEYIELDCANYVNNNSRIKDEMADCILVIFAMATHFNIDILSELEKKVLYNEKR